MEGSRPNDHELTDLDRLVQPQTSPDRNAGHVEHNGGRRLGYHRDFLKRNHTGYDINEHFLDPYDGRLCRLVVQGSPDVLQSPSKITWYRTEVRDGSPWMIRISNWALSRDRGSEDDLGTDFAKAVCRWIPACLALSVVVSCNAISMMSSLADGLRTLDDHSRPSSGYSLQLWEF